MASFPNPSTNTGGVIVTLKGDRGFFIATCDITKAIAISQQVLELREHAAKITSITINASSFFQALEEQEEADPRLKPSTTDWQTDPVAASVCKPLLHILTAIEEQGGGLRTFSWPATDHTSRKFTRPRSFWMALVAHAPTLENLRLDFFCHEVQALPLPLTAEWAFPRLKTLRLDTSSAHGDDGTIIDVLLQACPDLDLLHFEWPPCDLDNCQIQNISWTWSFPKLKHLYVLGWNFAPAAYTDFLARHPSISSLEERVDGPYDQAGAGYADVRLPSTTLSNLETLRKEFTTTHRLRDYFESAANRPTHTLTLHTHAYYGVEHDLLEIAMLPTVQNNLHTLELLGSIQSWRDPEPDTDRSDGVWDMQGSGEGTPEPETSRLQGILETILPFLHNLETLSIEMDSSNGTWDPVSRAFVYPEPMHFGDLISIFELLPRSCEGKLRLLRMKDARAKADVMDYLGEYLNDQLEGLEYGQSTTGSLQELEWCGEEKHMFDVSQIDSKRWKELRGTFDSHFSSNN